MVCYSISGQARHGKDTISDIIVSAMVRENKKVLRIAFADKLKEIVINKLNKKFNSNLTVEELNHHKNNNIPYNGIDIRKHLQNTADELKKNDRFYFIKALIDKVKKTDADIVVITDTRLPVELSMIKLYFDNIHTIKVTRKIDNIIHNNHETEKHIAKLKCDHTITNNGTLKELEDNILRVIYSHNDI